MNAAGAESVQPPTNVRQLIGSDVALTVAAIGYALFLPIGFPALVVAINFALLGQVAYIVWALRYGSTGECCFN